MMFPVLLQLQIFGLEETSKCYDACTTVFPKARDLCLLSKSFSPFI